MKLLIIGGTGFFGKSILDYFIKKHFLKFNLDEIIVFSRNTDSFKQNYPELKNEKITYLNGDITKINNIPQADLIIHAASSSNKEKYIHNSSLEKSNNEESVFNFCKIIRKIKTNTKILYCSSGAVYGQQPSNVLKIKEDFIFQDVDTLEKDKRDYALSKRNAEKMIQELGKDGYNVSIARCFSFFGKYLPKDQHFAYGNFIKQAENKNDIKVNTKHQVIRSYMDADQLVESLIKICLSANSECPVFNVGSDKAISIFDLAENLALKYGVRVIKQNKINFNRVDRYVPNVNKLKKLI